MKKILLLSFLIFAIATSQAQNFLISFTGTGASTIVDSVKVENLTQCTTLILSKNEVLHLSATVDINEYNTSSENPLNIYPNPTKGNCTIDFNAPEQGITTIKLFDITGKTVCEIQEFLTTGYHSYNFNNINGGVYFVQILSDKFSYSTKILSLNATFGNTEIKHIETTPVINKENSFLNGNNKSLKSTKSGIDMLYYTGERLKLTGYSGNYRTVFMIVPASSQTVTFTFVKCTDADSNNYVVVQIGSQLWMGENLRTTKYSNGNIIPNVLISTQWDTLTHGACCDYNFDANNSLIYGKLYNWYAGADIRNIAPIGWHVATDGDWSVLTTYLLGESVAGGKLKANCITLWDSPNTGATNESGFSALPAGRRVGGGVFDYIGTASLWWTSTEYTNIHSGLERLVRYDYNTVVTGGISKEFGQSVRCVKD